MSATLLEEFLNNFDFFLASKGNIQFKASFRYPTVITSMNGVPNARTMVLRDVVAHKLIFFTDIRSPKSERTTTEPKSMYTCL